MKTPTCTSAITQNVDHRVVLVAIRIPSSCTRLPDVESVARARAPACDRPMSTDLCTAIGGTLYRCGDSLLVHVQEHASCIVMHKLCDLGRLY